MKKLVLGAAALAAMVAPAFAADIDNVTAIAAPKMAFTRLMLFLRNAELAFFTTLMFYGSEHR